MQGWGMRRALLLLLLACGSESTVEPSPSGGAGVDASTTPRDAGGSPSDKPKEDAAPPPPPDPETRFLAIGDTGKGTEGQQAVADAMAAKCKVDRCDFAVMLGDNLYESGASSPDDPQFKTKFEDVYAALPIDFYVVLGNHDYGGNGSGTELGKGKNEVDYTSRSRKWKMPAAHYHFTKADIEFFALDTNLQMFGVDGAQKTDVDGWIAASKANWKIALGHHPYKSNGPHGNAGSYDGLSGIPIVSGSGVKSFLEGHVCGKVDLYLSGHDHSMQWLNETCMGTPLAVSGAAAEFTTLGTKNATAFQAVVRGFMYITVKKKQLVAEFIDENGTLLHRETLNK